MKIYKIALDAGHGLYTSGKQTPDGIKEWTLNDKVRDKVADILKDYNTEIIYTDNDEGEVDESLPSRLAQYKKEGVDGFASMHHNAFTSDWNDATGVEVYVDKNPTEADIKLAQMVYNRLVEYTGLVGRGIKRANFTVINQNSIPAILVEGGFMDGKKDYKYITSDEGQTAYAKAVAEGFIEFFKLEKRENQKVNKGENMEHPFVDIKGHYSEQAVLDLFKMGIVHGVGDNKFMPTEPIKRGDAAIMIRNAIKFITGK